MITEKIVRFLYCSPCTKVENRQIKDNGVAFTLISEDDTEFKKTIWYNEDAANKIDYFVKKIEERDLGEHSGRRIKVDYNEKNLFNAKYDTLKEVYEFNDIDLL